MSQRFDHIQKEQILKNHAIKLLEKRGVKIEDIAQIVLDVQRVYLPDLTLDACIQSVQSVINKRETQNAIITGIEIDMAAEAGKFSDVLNNLLLADEGLYGIDEILSLSIVNIYGSIGFTNFGYLDKVKFGIIKELDETEEGECNTFLDDLIGAIAAAAASRIAHTYIPD